MRRCWIIPVFLSFSLLAGCGHQAGRMDHPEDVRGRYHDQIAVAKRLLEQ